MGKNNLFLVNSANRNGYFVLWIRINRLQRNATLSKQYGAANVEENKIYQTELISN